MCLIGREPTADDRLVGLLVEVEPQTIFHSRHLTARALERLSGGGKLQRYAGVASRLCLGLVVKFEDSTQESKGENTQETDASSPESSLEIKNSGESIQESIQETQSKGESIQESIQETPNRGKSIQENKSNAEKVVELLRIHPMITLTEVAARLALSRIGVQKITDRLKADGRLKREGSTKAGRWVVLD